VAEREYSFEEIDGLVRGLNVAETDKRLSSMAAAQASPADVIGQICPIYRVIRPILQGILLLPFIPESWKQVIRTFIRLMDLVCPQT
jgi:hypothetical protein